MPEFIATFGHCHRHPLTGETLAGSYTTIEATSKVAAYTTMFRSIFGQQWASMYRYADAEDIPDGSTGHAAGVREYRLRHVEFVPPSSVSVALWDAYVGDVAARLTETEWVEVAQPAEVAHQRAVRDLHRSAEVADLPRTAEVADLPRSAEVADLPRTAEVAR